MSRKGNTSFASFQMKGTLALRPYLSRLLMIISKCDNTKRITPKLKNPRKLCSTFPLSGDNGDVCDCTCIGLYAGNDLWLLRCPPPFADADPAVTGKLPPPPLLLLLLLLVLFAAAAAEEELAAFVPCRSELNRVPLLLKSCGALLARIRRAKVWRDSDFCSTLDADFTRRSIAIGSMIGSSFPSAFSVTSLLRVMLLFSPLESTTGVISLPPTLNGGSNFSRDAYCFNSGMSHRSTKFARLSWLLTTCEWPHSFCSSPSPLPKSPSPSLMVAPLPGLISAP
mmetsp:Transcript_8230/g.13670  ORF Transcript_8230/g.13670 Transcript_8230/m.13670 type:complete len:282 (+) Transcript_8230:2455-3300(+)